MSRFPICLTLSFHQVNLKEDYRRWKSVRGEFSFCDHAFVLEPASKSRVLMYDATAQVVGRVRTMRTPI